MSLSLFFLMKGEYKMNLIGSDLIVRPVINYERLSLSRHCLDRIKERFPNVKEPRPFVVNVVKEGRYCGQCADEEGNIRHAFVHLGKTAYVSLDLKIITTVIPNKKSSKITTGDTEEDKKLNEDIYARYAKELRKLDRAVKKLEKDKQQYLLMSNIHNSNLMLRIHKTKSEQVKKECYSEISSSQLKLTKMNEELYELQNRQTRLTRSIAAVENAINHLKKHGGGNNQVGNK